tara:strand:- start:57 stop:461 length:405 start_codon:yes stop_codon:yes gene_type:complete
MIWIGATFYYATPAFKEIRMSYQHLDDLLPTHLLASSAVGHKKCPRRLFKIYWRMVSFCGNENFFKMEQPPRTDGHLFYMRNPKEFYARYGDGDGWGDGLFKDGMFSKFCPKSYSKKKVAKAKEELLCQIFNTR